MIPRERIEAGIVALRGRRVMLGRDLAVLYGVSTRRLNEQVKRNSDRFPPDFMFQLTWEEVRAMWPQPATADEVGPRSQIATLKRGRNIKYRPYAFTEHGAVMAASILNTPRAIQVSVFVVRAFVRLSRLAADQRQFALKLAELEAKLSSHDRCFQAVFAAIRKLMQPTESKKRRIGFATGDARPGSASDLLARDGPRRRRRP
ncbi:ORF6N domain-containing protein [candidate division WOR-3 bacterium]|nr:ORF6N domain-containing protein [candidate division WOR-3 bacterium]